VIVCEGLCCDCVCMYEGMCVIVKGCVVIVCVCVCVCEGLCCECVCVYEGLCVIVCV